MTPAGDARVRRGIGPAAVQATFILAPLCVLTFSYLWLAVDHQTFWLWNVIVHESGRYTLGGTIFYFSHFLREVPTDIAMALFLVAAWGVGDADRPRVFRASAWLLGGAAAVVVGAAWEIEVSRHGVMSAAMDLLQYRTRDDMTAWGSHWQFHLLSTLWFAAAASIGARVAGRANTEGSALWALGWSYFGVMTLDFGLSMQPVLDPRFIGHQAREIVTHGPVTCLLVLGLLMWTRPTALNGSLPLRDALSTKGIGALRLAVFGGVPIYLIVMALTRHSMESGQQALGLSAMVAAHVFEHVLDYVLVALLALAVSVGRGRPRSASTAATPSPIH